MCSCGYETLPNVGAQPLSITQTLFNCDLSSSTLGPLIPTSCHCHGELAASGYWCSANRPSLMEAISWWAPKSLHPVSGDKLQVEVAGGF
jgi:hypothetical protein